MKPDEGAVGICRNRAVARHSTKLVVVGSGLTPEDYRARNLYMVDHANVLILIHPDRGLI